MSEADQKPPYPPYASWGEGGKGTPSQISEYNEPGPFDGLTTFFRKNFSRQSLQQLAEIAETNNRFQRGTESLTDLLSSTNDGELLLETIRTYYQELKKKNLPLPTPLDAPGGALHLQDILEILAKLTR